MADTDIDGFIAAARAVPGFQAAEDLAMDVGMCIDRLGSTAALVWRVDGHDVEDRADGILHDTMLADCVNWVEGAAATRLGGMGPVERQLAAVHARVARLDAAYTHARGAAGSTSDTVFNAIVDGDAAAFEGELAKPGAVQPDLILAVYLQRVRAPARASADAFCMQNWRLPFRAVRVVLQSAPGVGDEQLRERLRAMHVPHRIPRASGMGQA